MEKLPRSLNLHTATVRWPWRHWLLIVGLLLSSSLLYVTTTTAQSNQLTVLGATYLSGPESSAAAAVDVAPDGTVVYAGTLPTNNFDQTPIDLKGGGNGVVMRFNAAASVVLSLTRIGNQINDMELNRTTGQIAIIGDFGVALLSADAATIVWEAELAAESGNRRVAAASDGTVAALTNKTITTYDASGQMIGQWTRTDTAVNDIALDPVSQSVFATGYNQVANNLKLPFLRSFSYTGEERWRNWGWSASEAQNSGNGADTEGYRVALGRDGKLYFFGETDGGNNVYRRQPRDLGQNAPNVGYDRYTQTFGISGSQRFIYYARLEPADGTLLIGQYALVFLQSGRNNTIRAQDGAIAADEAGTVYLGGRSSASIDNRANLFISGQAVGPYSGGDPYVLVVAPDFQSRESWVAFVGADGGRGRVRGIAAGQGVSAAAVTGDNGQLFTYNPLQAATGKELSSDNTAGFLATWQNDNGAPPPVVRENPVFLPVIIANP